MGQKDLLPNVLVFTRFGARYVFSALLLSYFLFFGSAAGAPFNAAGMALFYLTYAAYVFLLSRLTATWEGHRISRWTMAGEVPLIIVSLAHDSISTLPLMMMIPLIQIEYGLRNTRESYIEAVKVTTVAVVLGLALRGYLIGAIDPAVWVMLLPMAFLGYYTWKVMQQRQYISDRAREGLNQLELATTAAGIATWTLDVKAKRLVWDLTAQAQAGFKPGEFKGTYKEFFGQMSKPDAQRVSDNFAAAIRERSPIDIEYDILWPDKSLHSIACRGNVVVNADGEVDTIIGVSMDQTRLNQDRADTTQAVERLALVQKGTGAGVWFYDVVNRRVTWDEQVHRIFGMTPGSFGGTLEHFTQTVHPDDREHVGKAIDRSLTQQQPFSTEFRIVTPDGATRVVSSLATVRYHERGKQALSMLGVVWDVTVQRKDQERLHAMSQRALSAGDALRVGAWRYWPGTGKLEIDKAFKQLVGLNSRDGSDTLEPVLGRLVAEDREGFLRTIQDTLAAGGEFSWFWRLHDDKGSLREFQWLGRVLPGFDGTEDELVACVMDVTRLVHTRKTLETRVEAERATAVAGGGVE